MYDKVVTSLNAQRTSKEQGRFFQGLWREGGGGGGEEREREVKEGHTFTVTLRHARLEFLKFERSFEIYVSLLNKAGEVSEFL